MTWLPGCGEDDGRGSADPELVTLLEEEAGQSEAIARCIAEAVGGDDAVDRAALEAVVRGEGTTDTDTADAYADAARACAEDALDDLGSPGAP